MVQLVLQWIFETFAYLPLDLSWMTYTLDDIFFTVHLRKPIFVLRALNYFVNGVFSEILGACSPAPAKRSNVDQ